MTETILFILGICVILGLLGFAVWNINATRRDRRAWERRQEPSPSDIAFERSMRQTVWQAPDGSWPDRPDVAGPVLWSRFDQDSPLPPDPRDGDRVEFAPRYAEGWQP